MWRPSVRPVRRSIAASNHAGVIGSKNETRVTPRDPSFDVPLSYTCSCSRERALAPLALFSDGELREMMQEETTEVTCQFCGRKYRFSPDDLLGLTKVN